MQESLSDRPSADARPVWLVGEAELERWLAGQPAAARRWARDSGFAAERLRLLLLPGADGGIAGAALGLGRQTDFETLSLWAFAALRERLPAGPWRLATPLGAAAATRAATGWLIGGYRYGRYRSGGEPARAILGAPENADLQTARRMAEADRYARDLINTPAGDLGTGELAQAGRELASRFGAHFDDVVGDALRERGFPAIHAVGRAGPQPPRLLDLRWGDEDAPRVTLVGKGVCFDTGGLDLKPSPAMALMKKDMGGAAIALGLAQLVMASGLGLRLRVLVPAVENSVDSQSYRPGDVLQTRKGLTVEVGNTDAEGRIVLADALALAEEEEPALLIDLATLTGAARTALGPELPAMYTSDESLAMDLELCGRAEDDPVWRMPLWTGYDDELSSKVADLNNMAPNAFAGSIIGALFLRRFVREATSWLHLDLYAWNGRERPGRPVGAEAQCLRGLFRLLEQRYPAGGRA